MVSDLVVINSVRMLIRDRSMQVLDFLSTAHPTIAKTYGRLSGMAGKQMQKPPAPVTSVVSSKRSLEEMDSEISHYEERLKRIHNLAVGTRMPGTEARQVRLAGKWKKWRGPWMDRPLGIVA